MGKNYYTILGLKTDATTLEIKKAFRKLAFQFHPDKNTENKKAAEEQFIEIQEAYETLGDEGKRKIYDLKLLATSSRVLSTAQTNVQHYFYMTCDERSVKLNDEFTLKFVYSGEGRIFRKPSLGHFHITGAPFVSFRNVLIEGAEVKETSLSYIISALTEGTLEIEPATIKIENKTYATQSLKINVTANNCFFSKNKKADGKPFKFVMNFESSGGNGEIRTVKNTNHYLLIPRSNYAHVYHRIGSMLKLIFFLWGFIIGWIIHFNPLITGSGGLAFGGFFANLLYLIAGVKPKFYFVTTYPQVKKYLADGYRIGFETGSSFLNSKFVYYFTTLLS